MKTFFVKSLILGVWTLYALSVQAQVSVPSIPPSGVCSGGNGALGASTTINNGETYWYTATGNLGSISINTGGTLVVCGDLTINSGNLNGGIILIEPGGSLSFGNSISSTNAQIVNRGTLNLDRNAGFAVNAGPLFVAPGASLNTNGRLTLNTLTSFGDNAQISIDGPLVVNGGGLAVGDNAQLDIDGNFTLNTNVDVGESSLLNVTGSLTLNGGNFNLGNSTELNVDGPVTTINSNIFLDDFVSMNLLGDFVFNGGAFELNDFSNLTVQGNSTINDEFTYAGNPGNGAFVNLQGSSTFNAPASFSQWVNVCSPDPLTPSDLGNATPGCVTPLPIELVSFEAEHNGADFEFEWETASELNNAYYFIEVSKDLVHWERVAQLNGGGTLPYGSTYAHTVFATRYMPYARLIQQDFDGQQEIFAPVSVSKSAQGSASLWKVTGAKLQIMPQGQRLHIAQYNLEGKLLQSWDLETSQTLKLPTGFSLWQLCDQSGTCSFEKVYVAP
jgi:hypothetical protein